MWPFAKKKSRFEERMGKMMDAPKVITWMVKCKLKTNGVPEEWLSTVRTLESLATQPGEFREDKCIEMNEKDYSDRRNLPIK